MNDAYGDGWNGNAFVLSDADGNTKRIDTFKTYSDKEWSHI